MPRKSSKRASIRPTRLQPKLVEVKPPATPLGTSMLPRPQQSVALESYYQLPFGATPYEGGVHFSVYSHSATAMRLLIYRNVNDREPREVISFDAENDRSGDVWRLNVAGLEPGTLYHLQAEGPYDPDHGYRFDGRARLIDPYAKALAGQFLPATDHILRPPKCVVMDDHFDWEGDRPLNRDLSDTVVYEMHVRGFTRARNSRVKHPGTYLGVIEKIPYLVSLGVTAVELMPIHEFPTNAPDGSKEERANYWGYDTMAFFAPHRGYAAGKEAGAQVQEFKQMVRALHQAGIEVILDVVYNHTAEGSELGPVFSFKGLENHVYYMLENGGSSYRNYSGCGNTVNTNHPVVRQMILDSLRYWVINYHIDGFRFDLASILSRNRYGDLVPDAPLVEAIAEDPLLADTKIIAEAWDAAGAYQVGSFSRGRWAEWNGRFRDDIRRFWRCDPHTLGPVATRMAGSSDLYQPSGRLPSHSVNFVTSHDGFPLADLVSYNHKHNEANGEQNRDGDNNSYSYNYGIEGPTRRKDIRSIRDRQIKNMLTTLLLSLGTPMLLSGDECRRTQRGNNNAYCQDNEISWFNWDFVKKNEDLVRFVRTLISFRNLQPTMRRANFLTGEPLDPGGLPDVSWFNPAGDVIDWHQNEHSLSFLLAGSRRLSDERGPSRHVLMCLHAGIEPRQFYLPATTRNVPWRLFLDTAAESPHDIYPALDGPAPSPTNGFVIDARSLRVFVSPPVK